MKIAFVRADLHNCTEAIPRAIDIVREYSVTISVLFWNRTSFQFNKNVYYENGINYFVFKSIFKNIGFYKIFNLLVYQIWIFFFLIKNNPDVVQFFDFQSALPCTVYGKIFNRKLIYDQRDPFALCYKFKKIVKNFIYCFDWIFMGASDHIIIPDENRKFYLGRWLSKKDVLILYNTCKDYAEEFIDANNSKIEVKEKVKIVYLGYLSASRAGEFLLDYSIKNSDKVDLVVAGDCNDQSLLEKICLNKYISYMGRVSHEKSLKIIASSDVVVLLYDPKVPVNVFAAPNKFYEAMCLSVPVIVPLNMALSDIVSKHNLGWTVAYGDYDQFDKVIDCISSKNNYSQLVTNCRNYYDRYCSYEKYFNDYKTFYRKIKRQLVD